MKVIPSLSQLVGPSEYVWARGIESFEKCEEMLEYAIPDQISLSDRPRIVRYKSGIGFVLYAIILYDPNLDGYL